MSSKHAEITIIGGGVVGLSVALGLLQAGRRVCVLDGADSDARASQGNFGLVWGQGKGWDFAPYAKWTGEALAAWPALRWANSPACWPNNKRTAATGSRMKCCRQRICKRKFRGLAAMLWGPRLAADLGFQTKIRPQRGELLITEKLRDRLPFISSTIRQVDEGGVQIGGTKADVGLDDSETLDVMAGLARHAVQVFPALADVRVVRAWGALRVMSPDGYPVYAQSRAHPGAYLVTCHSGVTLASLHASALTDWIEDTSAAPDLEAFDEHRFSLSPAA